MKIRLATLNTPLFREGGLNLSEGWREFDTDELTPEQRDLIEAHVGSIIQVEPGREQELADVLGVDLVDGKFKLEGEQLGERHRTSATAAATVSLPKVPDGKPAKGKPAAGSSTSDTTKAPGVATAPLAGTSTDTAPVQPQPTTDVPEKNLDANAGTKRR